MNVAEKLQALLAASNTTTGETDTTLTDAVRRLVDGYGQGGGGLTPIATIVSDSSLGQYGGLQIPIDKSGQFLTFVVLRAGQEKPTTSKRFARFFVFLNTESVVMTSPWMVGYGSAISTGSAAATAYDNYIQINGSISIRWDVNTVSYDVYRVPLTNFY